jgi:hypothetical protein
MAVKYYATLASSYTAISVWTPSNTFQLRKPSGLSAVQTMVMTRRLLLINSHQFHITQIQLVLSVNLPADISTNSQMTVL